MVAIEKQYLVNLPVELLLEIFLYLTIRQLAILSCVNRSLSNFIIILPIWKEITIILNLPSKSKLENSIATVLRHKYRICELCSKFSPLGGYNSALNIKVTGYNNYYIQLCINCRNNYYNKHPECINNMKLKLFDGNNYTTKFQIRSHLYLKNKEISTINKSNVGKIYNVDNALKVALRKYGGIVGYKAALKKLGDTALLKKVFPKQKMK